MNLYLKEPTLKYKNQAIEYINEFLEYNSNINGTSGLDDYLDNYELWLKKLENNKNRIPNEDKVPSNTFFLIREEDDKIIGMINIRLVLNEKLLKTAGNIGFSIRPTERRKGYAEKLSKLGLNYCKENNLDKVLLTCDKTNIGSDKTIIKCGGIFENELIDELDGELTQRYWITI